MIATVKNFFKALRSLVWRRKRIFFPVFGAVILAIAAVAVLAACPKKSEPPPAPPTDQPTASQTSVPSPSPSPEPSAEPSLRPEETNPLSGMPMNEMFAPKRPVAVMLNNIREALPLYGISRADLIYEANAEGGITRLLAFYKDPASVPRLGSIRSTRAYYLDFALSYDAILVHAGQSPEALQLIQSRGMFTVNAMSDGKTFYRDKDRLAAKYASEHTLFAKGEDVAAAAADDKRGRNEYTGDYDPFNVAFGDEANIKNPQDAAKFSVKFSPYKTGGFEYDAETGLYAVSQYGKPMIDGETDEQLMVKNVLVIYTDVSAVPGDKSGRLKTRTTGVGDGMLFSDGKCGVIHWSKEDYDKPYFYTDEDGEPVTLPRGVSYVCVVPIGAAVKVEDQT